MKIILLNTLLTTLSAALLTSAPLPPTANLKLIEEIDASQLPRDPGHFKEYPEGISKVQTILGHEARTLPDDAPGVKYFAYLIGANKGLKANHNYVLELVYPEDEPRSMILLNRGNETLRGFHTGNTLGDTLYPKYVYHAPESLEIPLSGEYKTVRMVMRLQDRFSESAGIRGADVPDEAATKRSMTPKDGFWVYLAQYEPKQDPLSQGTAIARIRLYEAPPFEQMALNINYPPADLPRRHLFFREEMADGVILGEPKEQGFHDPMDWYRGKAELMRFLGMNTMAKDLLEFGANQGWDSSKHGGNRWVYQSHDPDRWSKLIGIADDYGLSVLPYYEYSGSKGQEGLGFEKRAEPLNGENYTHISWTETARADLTDPDTFEDFRKMLEITIVDEKHRADFVGAWLRPRSSQLPISFSDATIERFAQNSGRDTVTRSELAQKGEIYDAYIVWWQNQRKAFLIKIRDYLRDSGVEDAVVIYTADPSEPGWIHPQGKARLVTEAPEAWAKIKLEDTPMPLKQAIDDHWSYLALTTPRGTWGKWEWQHAAPTYDPANYRDVEGVLPSYSFNRLSSVADPMALETFTTASGLAMMRHYGLNENMLREKRNDKPFDPLGYFVADMERVGPHIMLPEVNAMAHGNPTAIGYLASNNFNRLSPAYVRRFNAAYLALPALPSTLVEDATSEPNVFVRYIDAGEHGSYYAVTHTGYQPVGEVSIQLPGEGRVRNAATGQPIKRSATGSIRLDLDACELVALHVK